MRAEAQLLEDLRYEAEQRSADESAVVEQVCSTLTHGQHCSSAGAVGGYAGSGPCGAQGRNLDDPLRRS